MAQYPATVGLGTAKLGFLLCANQLKWLTLVGKLCEFDLTIPYSGIIVVCLYIKIVWKVIQLKSVHMRIKAGKYEKGT